MDIPHFPRVSTRGLRKLSANHLIAARLADSAEGLPPGIRHPNQLLAALRRAAPYLGYRKFLPLMETLFRWTQPQDWSAETRPVVWPSNDTLAAALDCSERHVSRLIAAAIEARLIVARDGADRRRRGLRQEGRIVWAWGLDLRPMAARHAEFLRAAEAGEAARRRVRELRRTASRARQMLGQMLDLARGAGLPAAALEASLAEADALAAACRRIEDPAALEAQVTALQALVTRCGQALEEAVEDADMSGSADLNVRPNIPTEPESEPERFPVVAAPVPAGLAVTPTLLAQLAPRLKAYLPPGQPGWDDVSAAAASLARHMGIPDALYGEACQALGRRPAAIALAIISSREAEHFHTSGPGGYLRGMLRRAKAGELHLQRSLHGMRERAFRASATELTAVNLACPPSNLAARMRYCRPNASWGAFASGNHG